MSACPPACCRYVALRSRLVVALLLAAGLLTPAASVCAAETLVVVVSTDSPVRVVDEDTLRRLYTGRSKSIDSTRVRPVDLPRGNALRTAFVRSVMGTSERRLKRRWAKQIFSGKGKPPRVLASQAAVVTFVSGSQDRLGYVSEQSVTSQVRVVARVPLP